MSRPHAPAPLFALALALALAACSGEPADNGDDTPHAKTDDAGTPDAGSSTPDAGPVDAGPVDAGAPDDAGSTPLDAGPLDAGPVDAGPVDAGPVDAGPVDAGPVDAGAPVPVTKFVVLGDQGEGNTSQYAVAAAIKTKCAAEGGCDFALLLGDNIYDSGVDSIDDPQWQTKFELPYRELDFPFYAVLGNHDYGGTLYFKEYGGLGNEWDKGPIEVQYAQSGKSTKWKMPATFYTLKHKNLGFMMLDSNSLLWNNKKNGDQKAWYASAVASLQPADWIFSAAHHPYRSNGKHGNAGNYDLSDVLGNISLPIVSGNEVKNFYEGYVCPTVDVTLAGHDHNRQWLEKHAPCGAELIISGAGSKTTPDENRGNPTWFEDFDTPGFLFVRVEGKLLTGQFYDETGRKQFERQLQK